MSDPMKLTISDLPEDRAEAKMKEQPNRESQEIYRDYHEINRYQFLQECQDGTGGFSGRTEGRYAKSYIVPNLTENFYKTRTKRAIYLNYFNKYIRSKYKEVFGLQEVNTLVEDSTGETVEIHPYLDYSYDVTGSGMNKNQFVKGVLNASWRDGVAFVLMDKRPEDLMPYAFMKTAIEVAMNENGTPMISTNLKGRMTSITFNEMSEWKGDKEIKFRRYWGVDAFRLEMSKDEGETWTVVEEVSNMLSFNGEPYLPVEPIISQERDNPHDYMPMPDSYSIAEIVLGIYDRGSVYDYLVDKQGHSIPVINGSLNGIPNGLYNGLMIPEGDNKLFQPFFMNPDPKLADVHANRIKALTEEMLDMMDDGGVTASAKSVSQESGVSKAFTFSAKATTSKMSVRLAMEVDRFLEESFKVYMNDSTEWKSVTTYPSEFIPQSELSLFDLQNVADYFKERGLMLNVEDIEKKILQKLNPNAESKSLDELIAEIESSNPTE